MALFAISLALPPLAVTLGASVVVASGVAIATGIAATSAQAARERGLRNSAVYRNLKATAQSKDPTVNGMTDVDKNQGRLNDTWRLMPVYIGMEFVPFMRLPH